ncbi:hypothetical protein [Sphingomonas carotinifaciens]|nr:hypothetical protein [Sphingomonas carotinifaciens]MBB4087283.1 hypothetical protein [Sphingomonas carotinifaciens]SDF80470.1 hypothetical protein SAMN05216557_10636 [Sphingomonas carotinifaciens]
MIALLRMSAGLIGWAIAFCLLYALHGIGCASGWATTPVMGASLHRVVLLAAWIGSVAATLALALRWREPGPALTDRAAAVLAWVGCAATVAGGLPILLVPDCL